MIRVLLTGGGTGGHFYPLISIAEELKILAPDAELYYAGPEPYDADALAQLQIRFIRIPAGKIRRYISFLNVLDILRTLYGVFVALFRIFILYPDVVVSKGGYTSVPIILVCAFFRIPIIVHESDAVMGRGNMLGSLFARFIIVAYDELAQQLAYKKNILQLGIPVRKNLRKAPTGKEGSTLHIDVSRPIILVLGGSQGADRINRLILDALDELLPLYTIVHQTGTQNFELVKLSAEGLITQDALKQYYLPTPFLDVDTLHEIYHLAKIVISRAGSTSIYEIALHGKPSILIPIPEDISHDQRKNAYAYARHGGGVVLEESNLTDNLLQAEIERIMQNPSIYKSMADAASTFPKHDSAIQIAQLVQKIAEQH